MKWLVPLALDDVQVLRTKEATYCGSWKRRGGTGAYHVGVARMMDRLEAMCGAEPAMVHMQRAGSSIGEARPDPNAVPQYDIFRHIAARPGGEDGTVLAVVRDLRRYLLLVEAEMVSQGAVPAPPPATVWLEDHDVASTRRMVDADYSQVEARVLAHALTSGSFYDALAADLHTTRDAIKRATWRMLYGADRLPEAAGLAARSQGAPAAPPAPAQPATFAELKADELERIHGTSAREPRPAQPSPRDAEQAGAVDEVPEHLQSVPTGAPEDQDGIGVEEAAASSLPRRGVHRGSVEAPEQVWSIVDRQLVSDDAKLRHLPRLRRELNSVEFKDLRPYYAHMYEYVGEGKGWVLHRRYDRWATTGH